MKFLITPPGIVIETYEQADQLRVTAERRLENVGAVLAAYPKSSIGLTLDSVKATQQWKDDYTEAEKALQAVRVLNSFIVKHYKKENRAALIERRIKQGEMK